MKIVIFTRTGFHHTYFINRLQEKFEISHVIRERYPDLPKQTLLGSVMRGMGRSKDEKFLQDFHEKYSAGFRFHRILQEYLKTPFDVAIEKPGTKYLNIGCGEINSAPFASWLKDAGPDIVAVLGSSVLKPHIIAIPSFAVNLHSGLSPYYRGTWSYGWPLVNGEPEYIGATVHNINPGIDSGDIIHQTRPFLNKADDLNSIFLKVIAEGVELLIDAIEGRARGDVRSFTQPQGGRLYCTKDFNAAAARACLANLESGVIEKYNADKEQIDSRAALFGYLPPRLFK